MTQRSKEPDAGKRTAGKAAGGRPSGFTQAIADAICERLIGGESLRTICLDADMPSATSVFRWLANDERAAFREQYARAREAQAERMAEEILQIADEEVTMVKRSKHQPGAADDGEDGDVEVVFDATAVQRNRLRVDARKWLASKLAPKKYGEKIAVGGADDLPPMRVSAAALTDDQLAAIAAGNVTAAASRMQKIRPDTSEV